MYVCMYVCMYDVRMYVCMYVCMYVSGDILCLYSTVDAGCHNCWSPKSKPLKPGLEAFDLHHRIQMAFLTNMDIELANSKMGQNHQKRES